VENVRRHPTHSSTIIVFLIQLCPVDFSQQVVTVVTRLDIAAALLTAGVAMGKSGTSPNVEQLVLFFAQSTTVPKLESTPTITTLTTAMIMAENRPYSRITNRAFV
jgi:hypothetical protein